MLGLSNILSTSSSTDQETYSLSLDGTGDFLYAEGLDGGKFPVTGSLSLWVKGDFTNSATTKAIFDDYSGSRDHFFIRNVAGGRNCQIQAYSTTTEVVDGETVALGYINGAGTFPLVDNQWNHIVVTWDTAGSSDDSNPFKAYHNGALKNSGTLEEGAWAPNEQEVKFGKNSLGSLDEAAMWDAVLDADAVAAIYNNGRPFNLTNDFGDYDNASDLVGYWKMFDGLHDDKVNGVVFDQATPTIGPNLITESSFETTDDWTAVTADDSTSAVSTDIAHSGTKSWKVTVDGTDTNLGVKQTIAVEVDTVYRADVWCYAHADNNAAIAMNMKRIDGNAIVFLGTTNSYHSKLIPLGAWTLLTGYFRTAASNTSLILKVGQGGSSGADGDIFYVDDVTLVKIGGKPGITAADATFSTDSPDQQPRAHALDLDGTGDYLNLGDTLDRGTGDFTVCFWAKVTHADMDDQNFISKKQGAQDFWRIRTLSTGVSGAGQITVVGMKGNVVAFSMTGAGVTDDLLNTWMHVGVTIDRDGNGVIYVNGATTTYGSTTDISGDTPEGVNLDNTGDFQIGALVDDGMQGQMDGVAIWDEALPADAIAAIYAAGRSHDLTTVVPGSGHYDADWTDDLQGYWRMGDGAFDDPAAGVIHDQLAIGPEILSNGDFASGQIGDGGYDWTATGLDTENTIVVTSNKLVMVTDGNNGNDSQALRVNSKGPDFEIGKTYRVEFDASDITGAGFKVVDFGGDTSKLITNVTSDGHYNATHVAENIEFAIFRMTNGSASAGKFDNISIKEIPGAGFGAEIVTNGTFDSDLTGWTTAGLDTENTIAVSDGKVVMATDGNNGTGGALLLQQADVFVLGKTYKIEFDAHDIAGAGFKIQSGGNENISGITADGHYVKYHVANSTLLRIYRRTGSSASSGKFDNISVKLLNGSPGVTTADATFVKLPV